MNLYAIFRRDGFADGPILQQAAARSTEVGTAHRVTPGQHEQPREFLFPRG